MNRRTKIISRMTMTAMAGTLCLIAYAETGCETSAVDGVESLAQDQAEEKAVSAPKAMVPNQAVSDLKPIDLTLVNANISAVKERLAALGVAVDIDPALSALQVSLQVQQMDVTRVIDEIAKQLDATVGKGNSTFVISAKVVGLKKTPSPLPNEAASVLGSLNKDVIRKVVHSNIDDIKNCYERELETKPTLQGRISIYFIIQSNGSVGEAKVAEDTIRDVKLGQCVVDAVKAMEFPAPEGGGIVVVTYPFLMSPPEK